MISCTVVFTLLMYRGVTLVAPAEVLFCNTNTQVMSGTRGRRHAQEAAMPGPGNTRARHLCMTFSVQTEKLCRTRPAPVQIASSHGKGSCNEQHVPAHNQGRQRHWQNALQRNNIPSVAMWFKGRMQ